MSGFSTAKIAHFGTFRSFVLGLADRCKVAKIPQRQLDGKDVKKCAISRHFPPRLVKIRGGKHGLLSPPLLLEPSQEWSFLGPPNEPAALHNSRKSSQKVRKFGKFGDFPPTGAKPCRVSERFFDCENRAFWKVQVICPRCGGSVQSRKNSPATAGLRKRQKVRNFASFPLELVKIRRGKLSHASGPKSKNRKIVQNFYARTRPKPKPSGYLVVHGGHVHAQ